MDLGEKRNQIAKEFAEVINRNSLENGSDTPDYVLAGYLVRCLENFNGTIEARSYHKNN